MLRIIHADLHIHTCLSPCANLDMTPVKIVNESIKKGLSMIAVTDHNSAENVQAVMSVAHDMDLCVIPGMEITTSEEAHIIGLFESNDKAKLMQDIVFEKLQPGENDEDLFGIQVIANEFDEVEGFNNRLLIGGTSLNLNQAVDYIHQFNGLAIAAHIDRDSYSIISQLGFIPNDLEIDAVEISRNTNLKDAVDIFKEYKRFPFITSSDSHVLEDIGIRNSRLQVEQINFNELRMALIKADGRKVITN